MDIVFFTHPNFLNSQSMPRFTNFLFQGMKSRGYQVEIWKPTPRFYRYTSSLFLKKWLGYIDQYCIFPLEIRNRLKTCSRETLFVFTDQALGPWVPLVADRHHVIHCHDFLAQRSALNQFPQNPTSFSGKQYQSFIRNGYKKGGNFISVSHKTKVDLQKSLNFQPKISEVVYNGVNPLYKPQDCAEARSILGKKIGVGLTEGFLLHVGGNQWYKNRLGVLEIYNAWRFESGKKLPLLLIGKEPNDALKKSYSQSKYNSDIYFLKGVEDEYVRMAYAGANLFLFPSLAEGFGWPIAEAMASGCPVCTTNEAPMTEVAGDAGIFIPPRPHDNSQTLAWTVDAAKVLDRVLEFTPAERLAVVSAGLKNAKRFESENALNKIEAIYQNILQTEKCYENPKSHWKHGSIFGRSLPRYS